MRGQEPVFEMTTGFFVGGFSISVCLKPRLLYGRGMPRPYGKMTRLHWEPITVSRPANQRCFGFVFSIDFNGIIDFIHSALQLNAVSIPLQAERKGCMSTPVMLQYARMKAKHPDTILLFRLGDFYETFEEDAGVTSRVLGIKLTKRGNGTAADIPLAGIPYHALDSY